MHNDSAAILDDLLSRYHAWARAFSAVPTCGADPMFRNAKSGKGWDSTSEVIDDELTGSTMQAVDFHIGELPDDQSTGRPYRSAIYCLARNCYTGRNVWMSPRLPRDAEKRAAVVAEARIMLTRRLVSAGVM